MQDKKPPEIPTPDFSEPPPWADRSTAESEQKNWGKLDEIRQRNDHWWLTTYGCIVVVITVVFSTLFTLSLVAWAWHYLAPSCWGWLSADQLGKVQGTLFSGGMGAIVTAIAKKQIDKG
ncbi:hypothetical protein [Paracoccus ravus]|uniref:hypothetical protein n=1 Tax=Paracoccus ravus TaxID=2447760 RepID=UPI00106E4076|nr:hypothetical protein [Paracoccus ravus]